MSKSKTFFYFCLSFILGIFLNSLTAISQPLTLGILILGIVLVSVFWKYKKLAIIGFCLIFLAGGIWRFQARESEVLDNQLREYNDRGEEVFLIGRVCGEPDVRERNTKLTILIIKISHINHAENGSRHVGGRVLATVGRYPEYQYGDELKIKGHLEAPAVFEDFNYKDYLAKEGIYSVIYYPEIELISRESHRDPVSAAYSKILGFKNKLRESIYRSLSPPQSSILGAMLLGDKRRMSEELKEKLNIAGVRHITAVSGMHVVILSSILMSLLIGLGISRGKAFYFSIILIFLFIIMIGAHPSAVRAGIMGGLFLLGQKIGRKGISVRTIVMAAGLMLLFNPLLLTSDVGFQLSFLAVLGIIYFGPIFKNWLKFIPEKKFINLRSIAAMTFSAQIFTLPILVYNFGRVSLVAPLANILILPAVYWIMILGFIFGLAGIIWQFLGWILSWPAWLLLTYLTKIIGFFSQTWAARTIENVHWIWLFVSYLVLGFLAWRLNERERLKFLNY